MTKYLNPTFSIGSNDTSASQKYRDNWEKVFGGEKKPTPETCPCTSETACNLNCPCAVPVMSGVCACCEARRPKPCGKLAEDDDIGTIVCERVQGHDGDCYGTEACAASLCEVDEETPCRLSHGHKGDHLFRFDQDDNA